MTRDDIGWLPRAQRIDAGQITSREVVEVAAAEQVFAEREAVARDRFDDLRNTARVVTRLGSACSAWTRRRSAGTSSCETSTHSTPCSIELIPL